MSNNSRKPDKPRFNLVSYRPGDKDKLFAKRRPGHMAYWQDDKFEDIHAFLAAYPSMTNPEALIGWIEARSEVEREPFQDRQSSALVVMPGKYTITSWHALSDEELDLYYKELEEEPDETQNSPMPSG
jgi:hypothetical protein